MSDVRRRIAVHIHAHPGVHFNGIVRALDLAPGQVQHHLKRLLADGFTEDRLYGRTHYYPAGFDAWTREALALLRRETPRDIVASVLDADGTRPSTVATDLDIARSTLEWHVERLRDAGILEKHHGPQNRVTLTVRRPDEVVHLLRDVDPTLLGRLVDRYTRLVDRLLAD